MMIGHSVLPGNQSFGLCPMSDAKMNHCYLELCLLGLGGCGSLLDNHENTYKHTSVVLSLQCTVQSYLLVWSPLLLKGSPAFSSQLFWVPEPNYSANYLIKGSLVLSSQILGFP